MSELLDVADYSTVSRACPFLIHGEQVTLKMSGSVRRLPRLAQLVTYVKLYQYYPVLRERLPSSHIDFLWILIKGVIDKYLLINHFYWLYRI